MTKENMMNNRVLDLSTMMARIILALLTAATVVLVGLWLRASDALGFFSTLTSVTVSTLIAANLRGERIGPPTAAAQRLQPLVDALAGYPGGRVLGGVGFKRGVTAIGVGLVVAIAEQLVLAVLFDTARLAPLWRGVIALTIVLLPTQAYLAWARSRQQYAGTKFAGELLGAARQVLSPGADKGGSPLAGLPTGARVALAATGRTASAVLGRIVVQLAIPALFSTPLSIAAVAVATITAVAGGPVFLALGRSLKAAPASPQSTPESEEVR